MADPKKRSKTKISVVLIAIVLLALTLSGCNLLIIRTPTPEPAASSTATAEPTIPPTLTETPLPTPTETPPEPTGTVVPTLTAEQQERVLLLVNREHLIPDDWEVDVYPIEDGLVVDSAIAPDLNAMLADVRAQGLDPVVTSAYRSIADQQNLFDYTANYYYHNGLTWDEAVETTLNLVAKPGTSEHGTGLAVDIYDRQSQATGTYDAYNPVNSWLKEHSWEYGFILRYTLENREKTGFAPEPWHFRYVGRDAARIIHDEGLTLEEYLER